MANPELVKALDYILNRCDEASIEVLVAAIERRSNDIARFGGSVNIPDPQQLAENISAQINAGIGAGADSLKNTIREMAVRLIRQEAPDLSDEQIAELTASWIPGTGDASKSSRTSALPGDVLSSMINQFVSFSKGEMSKKEDRQLRDEMGSWPQRYWKAFPPYIRAIISDYLKDKISGKEFGSKIRIALEM
jgi:hypothetical protein